jgi:hypothetical protein
MRPFQVAESLRQIATRIQNSRFPHRCLVAQDLNRILAALSIPELKQKLEIRQREVRELNLKKEKIVSEIVELKELITQGAPKNPTNPIDWADLHNESPETLFWTHG